MTTRCPSDYALEAHLLTHGNAACSGHVRGCGSCQARLERMEQEGNKFNISVYPATIDKVLAARQRRKLLSLGMGLWLIPAAGIAVSALLITRAPGTDYIGLKGSAVELLTFVNDSGGAKMLSDGAVVSANAELRFKFRTERPCRLWIVSLDGSGQVSQMFPADGTNGAPVSGTMELQGGAVLDGKQGLERLFAVCSPTGLSFDDIARAARKGIALGEPAVRREKSIPGLPSSTLQTTLLLEKR